MRICAPAAASADGSGSGSGGRSDDADGGVGSGAPPPAVEMVDFTMDIAFEYLSFYLVLNAWVHFPGKHCVASLTHLNLLFCRRYGSEQCSTLVEKS